MKKVLEIGTYSPECPKTFLFRMYMVISSGWWVNSKPFPTSAKVQKLFWMRKVSDEWAVGGCVVGAVWEVLRS